MEKKKTQDTIPMSYKKNLKHVRMLTKTNMHIRHQVKKTTVKMEHTKTSKIRTVNEHVRGLSHARLLLQRRRVNQFEKKREPRKM